jgi:ABC-2 type transport system permease protein/oleandomycin transport system permease protein
MASVTAPAPAPSPVPAAAAPGADASVVGRVATALGDGLAVTGRNLRAMSRNPDVLVFGLIQPLVLVVTFRYVFSGRLSAPGVDYVDYLMPGIYVQAVVFGAMNTTIGLAEDMRRGLIERFRSLPMARSAVLVGRTLADMARNVVVVGFMCLVGFAVGFRVHTGPGRFLAAMAVMLLFGFAVSWVFATVALSVRSVEAAQAAVFPPMSLLVFSSSAFVPVESMPSWLQGWGEHQPVTAAIDAVRALALGGPTTGPVLAALAWSAGILAVFVPLAVRAYRHRT